MPRHWTFGGAGSGVPIHRGAELRGRLSERLRDDTGACNDGHEIRVTRPPGDNVQVEMFHDTGACDSAQVGPDVESVGSHDLAECGLALAGDEHELEELVGFESIEIRDLPVRDDHEVAPVVGIGVQEGVAGATAKDDMVGDVFRGLPDLVEEGMVAGLGRGLWSEDVVDAPGSVQDGHGDRMPGGDAGDNWRKCGLTPQSVVV